MALRGDLVGEAFVRITADTTAMRQAVRRAGKDDGKAYGTSFSKEVEAEADKMYRRTRTKLARAMSDPKQFDKLAKNFGSADEAAEAFRRTLQQLRNENQMSKRAFQQYTTAVNNWEKSASRARVTTVQLTDSQHEVATVMRDIEEVVVRNNRAMDVHVSQYGRVGRAMEVHTRRGSRLAGMIDNAVIATDRLDHAFDLFNRGLGRSFGKGSRNNFVNWVGSMVQGLSTVATKVITFPTRAVAHIGNSFGDAFSLARANGVGKLAASGKGLLAVFGGPGGLAGAVLGVVVGATALGEVLPGIVSLLTMLGGVVVSLVGSIGIGLTGALLALAPAAVGAAAGLGGLLSVFTGFFRDKSNAQFVKNFFQPFKDMNKTYYPQVRSFLNNVRGGFDDLIKDIRPSIDAFFSTFQKRVNDKSTRSALAAWSDSIGRIATSLSGASTSFLSGLIGFFRPVLPYAEKLANYIERIAKQFDTWANSTEGQNSIAAFMDKAWVAADKVWKILGNILGIIGKVFMGGEQTGTTLLDRMLQKLQEINTFLSTKEGQEAMARWFGDVQKIGEDLGKLATAIGKIIINLNSPEGRANAKAIMDAVVGIANAVVGITKVADQIARIAGLLNPIKTIFGLIRGPDKTNSRGTDNPQSVPALDNRKPFERKEVQSALNDYALNLKVTPQLDKKALNLQLAAIEAYKSTGVEIPVKGNETLWNQTKGTIAQTIFKTKSVPVKGNEEAWNRTKGTIAAHVFKPKVVNVVVADKDVRNWISWWNRVNLNKTATIRYTTAGTLPNGGRDLRGGTFAAGGILTGARRILAGEAGPEAIVPLDRPLSMVDPAVRALSAFAQGKTRFASGGVVGSGRTINIQSGAIVVNAPNSDAALVAESVLDRLAALV